MGQAPTCTSFLTCRPNWKRARAVRVGMVTLSPGRTRDGPCQLPSRPFPCTRHVRFSGRHSIMGSSRMVGEPEMHPVPWWAWAPEDETHALLCALVQALILWEQRQEHLHFRLGGWFGRETTLAHDHIFFFLLFNHFKNENVSFDSCNMILLSPWPVKEREGPRFKARANIHTFHDTSPTLSTA